MQTINAKLQSIHVGGIATLEGTRPVQSGFVKHLTRGPLTVTARGIEGDEQADLRVHGGPEKAIYAYPADRYPAWREMHPAHSALLVPGGLGENLAIEGVDETSVCIGDTYRFGDDGPVLQVAQPRQPCFKLTMRFGADSSVGRSMTREGWSGWYFRVIEARAIRENVEITLLARPNPSWSVSRFFHILARQSATAEELAEWRDLAGLASHWRRMARETLEG